MIEVSGNYDRVMFDLGWIDPGSREISDWNRQFPRSLYYVDARFEVVEGSPPERTADELLTRFEALFRVFQTGRLWIRRYSVFEPSGDPTPKFVFIGGTPVLPEPKNLFSPAFEASGYQLDDARLDGFEDFFDGAWPAVIDDPTRLGGAVHRFSLSLERWTLEDRLLDLIVTLEHLFSEGADSITYKVCLRTAAWTNEPGSERKAAFKRLKRAYDLRSKIVHGNRRRPTLQLEFVEQIESDVRKALQKMLSVTAQDGTAPSPADIDETLFFSAEPRTESK